MRPLPFQRHMRAARRALHTAWYTPPCARRSVICVVVSRARCVNVERSTRSRSAMRRCVRSISPRAAFFRKSAMLRLLRVAQVARARHVVRPILHFPAPLRALSPLSLRFEARETARYASARSSRQPLHKADMHMCRHAARAMPAGVTPP